LEGVYVFCLKRQASSDQINFLHNKKPTAADNQVKIRCWWKSEGERGRQGENKFHEEEHETS
jgi:hypothetical protein